MEYRRIEIPCISVAMESTGEIWFENGVMKIRGLDGNDEVRHMSPQRFGERLTALRDLVVEQLETYAKDVEKRIVPCGKDRFEKFYKEAMNLIADAAKEISVDSAPSVIMNDIASKKPTHFGYHQRPSGIVVPS
jgi:hypothetical protein